MKRPLVMASLCLLPGIAGLQSVGGQNLPASLDLSISGSFANAVADPTKGVYIYDNNLTNGYAYGFDTHDAPAALVPTGPAGSAAFQWGTGAYSGINYPHPSALWFQPLDLGTLVADESFELGYLFYRNGDIKSQSGATAVDLALHLSFDQPAGLNPVDLVFCSELINTVNNSDPVSSADYVSLRDTFAPLDFADSVGNQYYLELTFEVDQDTIDGSLSTQDEFHVFEGKSGRAVLLGRFTTSPLGGPQVPELSAALLAVLGLLPLLIRRKR